MPKINLSSISTDAPSELDKDYCEDQLKQISNEIGDLSEILYAQRKKSLLVVLQGMDASGKDGVAKSVFSNCPPLCLNAYAFKKPSPEEMAHDFLWRIHKQAPEKGQIKLFIRSHYEDVLIQRVHQWINDDIAAKRFKAINQFEHLLEQHNDTTVLKFYLHISHERQLEKLKERITEPDKFWKHNAGDMEESQRWEEYMGYYEQVFENSEIPWHIVPSDSRWYRNYFVAKIILETLQNLDLSYPPLKDDHQA